MILALVISAYVVLVWAVFAYSFGLLPEELLRATDRICFFASVSDVEMARPLGNIFAELFLCAKQPERLTFLLLANISNAGEQSARDCKLEAVIREGGIDGLGSANNHWRWYSHRRLRKSRPYRH